MRIMSFRVAPVARICAVVYGILGLIAFTQLSWAGAKQMIMPFGVFAPMANFTFNIHLPMPTQFGMGVLGAFGTAVSFAASGWLTGTVGVLAFNLVARMLGGVDASVLVKESESAIDRSVQSSRIII